MATNLNLKFKILEKFNTQSNFAERIGQADCVVSRVIHGRLKITDENRKKWAKILECKPKEIFGE